MALQGSQKPESQKQDSQKQDSQKQDSQKQDTQKQDPHNQGQSIRDPRRDASRKQAPGRKRNLTILLIIFGIIIVIAAVGAFLRRAGPSQDTAALAKCLTEKGFAMAGTEWCPHCRAQKEMFGDSFQYVTFHDCDQDTWCAEHNITSYPTWVSPLGSKALGTMSLAQLKTMAGC